MNDRLANEKISSLLLSLAIPSILAQLATLIYNMVDRIYIGRLPNGSLSIAGIGLCTSIITIRHFFIKNISFTRPFITF